MKLIRPLLAILGATIWISISEFVRNEYLVKSYWVQHYQGLGLTFPADPVNGAMWGVWSLFLAITIYFLSRKYALFQTTLFSWFVSFVMMWVVIGNLNVLPYRILWVAIPLSILETFIAGLIIRLIHKSPDQ
jgi:hypothetical protein